MNLYDLILKTADAGLALMQSDGSMPAGHNGPYKDKETPLRNTAHWVLTFTKAYEISRNGKYLDAVKRNIDFILDVNNRPMHGAFFCRKNPMKDFSNGLVGQAWTFEALNAANMILDDERILSIANDVFEAHFFDPDVSLWRILNVDGSYNVFDMTINHQIWFAACAALIITNDNQTERIRDFIAALDRNLVIHPNGRINHNISCRTFNSELSCNIKTIRNLIRNNKVSKEFEIEREIGYHQFNLYGLSLLKLAFPDEPFWKSHKITKILKYVSTREFEQGILLNRFGYPYNPPGIEVAFALSVFNDLYPVENELIEEWLSKQFFECFDFYTNLMTKRSADPMTSAARFYEVTRMEDREVNI